jgi:aminoglycoside 3-N-acetyltransferase
MNPADLIYKLLPESYFRKIRDIYYKVNQLIFPPLNKQKFRNLLTGKLGVQNGMVLYIHSSMDKLNIDFSPFELLELLLEVVGESGTLVFPCWHYRGRAEDYLNQSNAVFNVRRSSTTMGLLPELARRHRGAVRSMHPTTSIVAIGSLANELIDEHHTSILPNGDKSPLFKIMNHSSKIIGLGEKVVSLSFVHVVEDIMNDEFPLKTLKDKPYSGKVIDFTKNEISVETLVPHTNISNRDISGFFGKHITKSACFSFKYKGVNYFTAQPNKLFDELADLAREGKTIYGGGR